MERVVAYGQEAQEARVFEAFRSGQPKTMLQVARETGVERANICWYLRDFREAGQLFIFGRGLCPVSHTRVMYYSTNDKLWQTYIGRFPELVRLSDLDFISIAGAIKSYYLNHYSDTGIVVTDSVRDLWENVVKPGIDRRVKG